MFEPRKIVKVELLGVTTGFQTKVLATCNYLIYSFLIHYADGSTERKEIAADGGFRKNEIDRLLRLAKGDAPQKPAAPAAPPSPARSRSGVYDDLIKIRDLYGAGVLTEEIYEKEKKVLLEELAALSPGAKPAARPCNLVIRREKKRAWLEDKVILVLDAQKREDLDTDTEIRLSLAPGTHHVRFRYALQKSPDYTVRLYADKVVTVTFLSQRVGMAGLCARIETSE